MVKQEAKTSTAGHFVTRSQKSGTKQTKWVMAVDPFSDLNIKPVAGFVKALADRAGAKVYGTYVLAPEILNWTGEFSGPWLKRYKPVAEEKAEQLSNQLGLDIEVVPMRKSGLRSSVETLLKYSEKIKAECIVVSTHARSGLERWMLGSFAESVLLVAKVPVIAINPTQKIPAQIKKILVPTDLSPQSIKFILKVAAFAQRVGAHVDLFYRRPDPLDPMIQQGVYAVGGGWVSVQSYLDESTDAAQEQLRKIEAGLRKRGVDVSTVEVTASGASSLVDSIEVCAKQRQADMISVLTQSGPVAASVLGSVARALVRTSIVPVMIYR